MHARSLVLASLLVCAPVATAQTALPQAPAAAPKGTVIQRIIVKVNGEIFTQTDLESRQVEALREQNRQVRNPQDLQNDSVLSRALADLTPNILMDVVDDLILTQRGRELGASFSDANFQQTLERIKKQNNFSDEQLKTALAQSGMTLNELRQNLERQYLQQYVMQNEVGRAMRLTEEELRQYYKAHPNDFKTPATITVREIFVEVPVTTQGGQTVFSAGADDAAKAKITAARERAVKGEDFVKIVTEVSEAGSKANGGLIGPVVISELSEMIAKAVGPLKAGEVSEPIRTPRGYMLFKLETRSGEGAEPFDEVREAIMQKIYDERIDGETKKHIDKLRAQALIEWKDDTYKVMYENAMRAKAK